MEKEEEKETTSEETQEDQAPQTQEAWQVPMEKRPNKTYVSILVTVGKFIRKLVHNRLLLSAEKKVLPLVVLAAFFVYSGVSAIYYFD